MGCKELLKKIQKSSTPRNVREYNAYILGIKDYYKIATHVSLDFGKIAYHLSRTLYNRLKSIGKYGSPLKPSETYKCLHKNKYKTFEITNIHLFPIADIQTRNDMNFSQDTCNYKINGRLKVHKNLQAEIAVEIAMMLQTAHDGKGLEYTDNRISRYSMQLGKCAITGEFIMARKAHCHHKLPRRMGGTDKFSNLVIVNEDIHRLIHATDKKMIELYGKIFRLDGKQLDKLNHFRKVCNLVALI